MHCWARNGSVKYCLKGVPINSIRLRPVSATVCSLTSEITPAGSVVISASTIDSISDRV